MGAVEAEAELKPRPLEPAPATRKPGFGMESLDLPPRPESGESALAPRVLAKPKLGIVRLVVVRPPLRPAAGRAVEEEAGPKLGIRCKVGGPEAPIGPAERVS